MAKKDSSGLHGDQTAQGVWERKTGERRWGQNQLFGSFRVDSGTVDPGVRVLNQGDPTDNALAAIASILDRPPDNPMHRKNAGSVENLDIPDTEAVAAAPEPSPAPLTDAVPLIDDAAIADDGTDEIYAKLGPGPLDGLRFKWTTRAAGDGSYFVDETIGASSRARTTGPMSKAQAIQFVDQRESDARRRFDALKSEMTATTAAHPAAQHVSEM
jgi:hypothetical protein